MRQTYRSLTPKQLMIFSAITVFGVVALLVGVFLIIFMRYHERAYVFLGLGAACFIGGIAGIIVTGPKVKASVCYGVIALGMIGGIVGLNYLTYHFASYRERGYIVIALSILIMLGGIVGALLAQPRARVAAVSSVLALGIVASAGIVGLILGTIYLSAFQYQGHAYPLLGAGALCLVGGIVCGILVQGKAAAAKRIP
ncbi:MAG TPA: hypothetical protein VNE61_09680 [Ktedonobacteraceae bacterium]|nr:hypothetical protein [Ktedonobacteraceae bacterium]